MTVCFYMDVHVPQAITDQLRRRGVDVLTAIEDNLAEATDRELLERAAELERVLFTQDIRFKAMPKIGNAKVKRFQDCFSGINWARQSVNLSRISN